MFNLILSSICNDGEFLRITFARNHTRGNKIRYLRFRTQRIKWDSITKGTLFIRLSVRRQAVSYEQ